MNREKDKRKDTPSPEEEKEGLKRRAALGALAVLTSAGVLVGGLFHSPDAILAPEQSLEPVQISQNEDEDPEGPEDEDQTREELSSGGEEKLSLDQRLRRGILRLPYGLRLLVILPLWALGWLLITGATALWSGVLSPALGQILTWALLLLALAAAFGLAVKTAFPDLPWKKIFNRRSLTGLLLAAGLLALADLLLPLFWQDYPRISAWVRALGLLLILLLAAGAFCVRELRRRNQPAPPPPVPESPPPRPLSREDLLAIADEAARHR